MQLLTQPLFLLVCAASALTAVGNRRLLPGLREFPVMLYGVD